MTILLVGAFLLDRLLKYFLLEGAEHRAFFVFPKILAIDLYKNYGIGLGIFLPRTVIIIVSAILIGAFCTLFIRSKSKKAKTALLFIIVGALGNFIDRLTYGYVVDYISVFQTSFINIPDILIALGIAMFLLRRT